MIAVILTGRYVEFSADFQDLIQIFLPVDNLEGQEIHYIVVEDEGGSAGPGFELRAWKKTKNRIVLITSYTQTELGQPNFDLAWAIISTVDINL